MSWYIHVHAHIYAIMICLLRNAYTHIYFIYTTHSSYKEPYVTISFLWKGNSLKLIVCLQSANFSHDNYFDYPWTLIHKPKIICVYFVYICVCEILAHPQTIRNRQLNSAYVTHTLANLQTTTKKISQTFRIDLQNDLDWYFPLFSRIDVLFYFWDGRIINGFSSIHSFPFLFEHAEIPWGQRLANRKWRKSFLRHESLQCLWTSRSCYWRWKWNRFHDCC